LRTPLPYIPHTARLFETLRDEPWAVFLDSGGMGRHDILAADPVSNVANFRKIRYVARAGVVRTIEELSAMAK